MSDQMDVLKDVVSRLDGAGIKYMISGSVALNYYGEPRMTRDIDLVVEMTQKDVLSATHAFAGDYYLAEESMCAAVAERGMFNLRRLFLHLYGSNFGPSDLERIRAAITRHEADGSRPS